MILEEAAQGADAGMAGEHIDVVGVGPGSDGGGPPLGEHRFGVVGPGPEMIALADIEMEPVAAFEADFKDLVKSGIITQATALPEEQDEASIAHLPRLVFVPHKRNYGRYRVFINAVNDCDPER